MKRPVMFDLKVKTTLRNMGVVGAVALAAALTPSWATAQSATEAQELRLDQQRDRTTLPPPESPFKGKIETDMKDSTQDWPQDLKAPSVREWRGNDREPEGSRGMAAVDNRNS
jgi:hypothetical protein